MSGGDLIPNEKRHVEDLHEEITGRINDMLIEFQDATLEPFRARLVELTTARPISEWDHEDGSVLWWKFPITEPPYSGTPNDSDWPGYHTHWTPIAVPAAPEGGAA